MRVQILGCSGGIGGPALRTTSLLLDDDVLIDAGTGSADLSLAALTAIDHVFITHAHLDHIACLPFILDSVGDKRSSALTVHATAATLAVLQTHIFNWHIWPDFSTIPSPSQPFLRFHTITEGVAVELSGGRRVTALPAKHTVPAVGYLLDSGRASLAFSGDTTCCSALWEALNAVPNLRQVIIEAAFPNAERELALLSKHLCPSLLEQELLQLNAAVEIFVTHAKPGQFEHIAAEIAAFSGRHRPRMLLHDQVFEL
ncbi:MULTISPECIES: 3',5'-cyclic-nucleotide phosphodiesterase [unclassified Undibacterium]|uniref:3',5'-cyclic-nucleotide phosphodiesterase n=1 Tax=unclassified Undibacterium TaxID=2630295 RepID=UPI002AC8C3A8|nr:MULTISPECIES: 3',5'-cyclic-nucleotide phosphodiesterase [unclassified Undibacterium]MEB0140073.1 3',5'-cyclic-nucleotide phosphodiesterase [Undibacterium sp. CCC2.1]MEB0173183.1 3',5'-cyclic-nucleotide phosphodiesterase [Undibacterium sp. CCC1.1]MEB0176890.1 3',5'-cyclic-nucleotide phosphodiesterase [Undibacterium sp. CCC3.4]MEB0216197.1 3',5'-cyclic-nucleotide phosphodiesterase [Undibacterium sp. 5I2]WPX41955.1 3',5'-cyclic-nucleotide phosphodiesterase [Undibacterium sp. CCC3.4]